MLLTRSPRARCASPQAGRAGRDWLNGPLVWAKTDDAHDFLYLFPRDCPRILVWPTPRTSAADRERWFTDGQPNTPAVSFIEPNGELERLRAADIVQRYELPTSLRRSRISAMSVRGCRASRSTPTTVEAIADLPEALEAREVELRALPTLTPLRNIWTTSLHASGIEAAKCAGVGRPGWPHTSA